MKKLTKKTNKSTKVKIENKEHDKLEVRKWRKHYNGKAKDVKHLVHIDLIKYLIWVAVIILFAFSGITPDTIAALTTLFKLGP